QAMASLDRYRGEYEGEINRLLHRKLGLSTEQDGDLDLINELFTVMREAGSDYTRTFRELSETGSDEGRQGATSGDDKRQGATAGDKGRQGATASDNGRQGTTGSDAFAGWLGRYAARLQSEPLPAAERRVAMLSVNPKYVLRNWMAEEVITAATAGDHGAVDRMRSLLDTPFDEHPGMDGYTASGETEIVVSCSS